MPVTGRKPKPPGQARHRVQPVHDWTEVVDEPFTSGPKLPARRLEGRAWPTRTKAWWTAVSSMPHCVLWSPSDWQFAIDTALVAAEFHDGDVKSAVELRNREKVMGTTVDYRRDIRVRYVERVEEKAKAEGVTSLDEYRQLYGDSTG